MHDQSQDSALTYQLPELRSLLDRISYNFILKAESIMPGESLSLSDYEIDYLTLSSKFLWATLNSQPFNMDLLSTLNGTDERHMFLERRFNQLANTIRAIAESNPSFLGELRSMLENPDIFTVEALADQFRGRREEHIPIFLQSLIELVSPNDTVYRYYKKRVDILDEFTDYIAELNNDGSNLVELLDKFGKKEKSGIKQETIELIKSYSYNPDFLSALKSLGSVFKRWGIGSNDLDMNLTSAISQYGFSCEDIKLLFHILNLIKPFFGINHVSTLQLQSVLTGLLNFYLPINPNKRNILVPIEDPEAREAFSIPNIQRLGLKVLADPSINRADTIRNQDVEKLEKEKKMTYAAKIRAKIENIDFQRRYGDPYGMDGSELNEDLIDEIAIEINSGIEYISRSLLESNEIDSNVLNRVARTVYVEIGMKYVPRILDETSFNLIFRAVMEVIEDNERFLTGLDRDEKIIDFGMKQSRELFDQKLTMDKLSEFVGGNSHIWKTFITNGLSSIWLLELESLIEDRSYDAAASKIYLLFTQNPDKDLGFYDMKSVISWIPLFIGWVTGTLNRSDISRLLVKLVYGISVGQKSPPIEMLY